MTPPRHDQPRGLTLHQRLADKLQALYQASDRGSHGNGTGGGTPPIPVSAAVVDARAWVERTLARVEAVITGVLAGGDSVVPVSGWWGRILCPVCGQDTLRLDLGARWVSCVNREDCDEGTGQPFSESEGWLEGQAFGERNDGGPTITQRQRQRIEALEGDVARWRDQAADWRALHEQAMIVLAAHGLAETERGGRIAVDELIAFLRERLDEDATFAYSGEKWRYVERGAGVAVQTADGQPVAAVMGDRSAHIARHDPARVLAEVQAKRRLLDVHEWIRDQRHEPEYPGTCLACWDCDRERPMLWPCDTVRLLALPYQAHPDYRPEWTPQWA